MSRKEPSNVVEKCNATQRSEELEFKVKVALDRQMGVERQLDALWRLMAQGQEAEPEATNRLYSPQVIAGIVQHWTTHILNVAESMMPFAHKLQLYKSFTQTGHNIPTASAAAAAILNLASELAEHMATITAGRDLEATAGPRNALHLYSTVYPTLRTALIDIARVPGPWRDDEELRERATEELRKTLTGLAQRANVSGASVQPGEAFTGLSNSASDRWLPRIQLGESLPPYHNLLLSNPPLIGAESSTCRRTSVVSWQNYFARKHPALVALHTPLFAEPMFPCPWSVHPSCAIEANIDSEWGWLGTTDAVEALLSWIGRALLTSGLQHCDKDMHARAWSVQALEVYNALRSDLVHALDTLLRNDVAHGLRNWPDKINISVNFIAAVLLKLEETHSGRIGLIVDAGEGPSEEKVEAALWLPTVDVVKLGAGAITSPMSFDAFSESDEF
jgi:hypothetical protein